MSVGSNGLASLLRLLANTREQELDCDEFLRFVGELAEGELADVSTSDLLEQVRHHLTVCADCREEYEALLQAIRVTK